MTAAIKLVDATIYWTETKTCMPFRFGIAVMTTALFGIRMEIHVDMFQELSL